MEQKYPKTVTYEDLDGNKKTTVVNSEFEQRVLELINNKLSFII